MADLTGQRLGQYLILERISKGATSTVYKAYQEKLERYVAVKVLSPHFIDEEGFLERFKQEARAVAQLDHPNILPVYDFDQVGDTVYIVMKYVDTGTLKELVGGPLDLRITLEIFTQVGLALGYAHRQGVIHRDVKPGNVLLGEGNWALLTDFGLAKMRAGDRKLTKSGIGMGTPDYMAPEQAQGLPVDGRVDLYSLGCVLHEMLTGKVPFEADSGMAVVIKHITEPPRPPREINPKLPLAVEQVILRSLEKDPHKRYQTAEAMVADLARAVGRPDQLMLPEALSAHPQGASRSIAPTATQTTLPAGPTRSDRTREWLRDKRPLVAAGARGAGNWFAVKLQRIAQAIRLDFERFARWVRRMMIALWTALQRGFNRARLAIVGLSSSIRAAAAPTTQPPPARSPTKTAKSKSTASNTSALGSRAQEPLTAQSTVRLVVVRVQASLDAVRRRAMRRRLALAGVVLLLIGLLAALALRPSNSQARVEATSTSIAAIDPTP
ncbi:MAG: serine/threonine-protein kinase, partial [Anaerolineae bacterium]